MDNKFANRIIQLHASLEAQQPTLTISKQKAEVTAKCLVVIQEQMPPKNGRPFPKTEVHSQNREVDLKTIGINSGWFKT